MPAEGLVGAAGILLEHFGLHMILWMQFWMAKGELDNNLMNF